MAKIKGVTPYTSRFDIDSVNTLLRREYEKHTMPIVDLLHTQTKDPFKILVATILSARTRDSITATVIKKLFARVHSLAGLKEISRPDLETLIRSSGFFREKARHLKELPEAVESLFGGVIPDSVEELVKLPGVGRKTANLVVAVAFDKPAICVDVHVHRICNRLGYIKTGSPFETEMTLRSVLPVKYWKTFNTYLVSFGQHRCTPVNPRCADCPLYRFCERVNVKTKYGKKVVSGES